MRNGLHRPGLAISLAADQVPFDENFVFGPKKFDIPILRVYIHELLHFWQSLSQAFFAYQALYEWRQLVHFQRSGELELETIPALKQQNDELYRRDPETGITAWSLSEALCRFWDMHILGPEKLLAESEELALYRPLLQRPGMFRDTPGGRQYSSMAFDLLLTVQDYYADPYRLALQQLGSGKAVLFFPLVGHFALQSPKPAAVYVEAMKRLRAGPQLPQEYLIHAYWKPFLETVEQLCTEICADLCDGTPLQTGWTVMEETELLDNPVWRHYHTLIQLFLAGDKAWSGRALALPGDPDTRVHLGRNLLPPLVRFRNGNWVESTALSAMAHYLKATTGSPPIARTPGQPPVNLEGFLDPETLSAHSAELLELERRLGKARVLAELEHRQSQGRA
jgi:hypothetical protein